MSTSSTTNLLLRLPLVLLCRSTSQRSHSM
jgi:hypothetical protein